MRDENTYRKYAADCRRIAATMSAHDKEILLRMAQLWEDRAEEAAKKAAADGQGKSDGAGHSCTGRT